MTLDIIFTDDAIDILLSITDFIENKWTSKEADRFLERVHKVLGLTAKNPYMFKASDFKDDIRIGYISKQTSFFYKVQENEIIILFFWDNRQEPFFDTDFLKNK
ncbi:MAG: type II toxin-antitoxin system RelE/ParE family toxin [Mucilaginibacter sp.]